MVDVAERAGVSHSTVSRVLTGSAGVHPETRAVVVDAIRDLGYVVNKGARSLAGGKSSVIGVVVFDFTSRYVSSFLAEMEKTLAQYGYSMLLGSAQGSPANPLPHIRQIVQQNICDGLVLLFPGYHRFFVDERNRQTLPFVLIDEPGSPVADCVYIDNRRGTYLAFEHLAKLGHRRIGFIGGHKVTAAGQHRLEGFMAATHELGLSADPELLRDGDWGTYRGFEAATELFALADPPTAIFAGSDEAAQGVLAACYEHQLRVPDDISLVGFDDLPIASQSRPPLTTIRQPLDQVTERAFEQLLRRIEHPKLGYEEIKVQPSIVIRESTAPVSSTD